MTEIYSISLTISLRKSYKKARRKKFRLFNKKRFNFLMPYFIPNSQIFLIKSILILLHDFNSNLSFKWNCLNSKENICERQFNWKFF